MRFSYQGSHPPSQLAALTAQSNFHITDDLDHLSLQQQPYQGAETQLQWVMDEVCASHKLVLRYFPPPPLNFSSQIFLGVLYRKL